MTSHAASSSGESLVVAGLFAGVGAIELGLSRAGHRSALLCEIDPGACGVLEARFPGVPLTRDIRELETLGRVDVLAAGFPCQDLSQAGRTAGITGGSSGLVEHVFRLLETARRSKPRWLLLENVPFMLQLQRGKAMRHVVDRLEELGFTWAYRVIDARAFGLPQRGRRPSATPRENCGFEPSSGAWACATGSPPGCRWGAGARTSLSRG
ncbi:MAG TPA: DNA (cytosine-5-)-methyltransferase [Vicinamibacterales bacterium]|nr:DNA (cytosine-5-)-methyltransferase [Vicinamibacterales bacterium]